MEATSSCIKSMSCNTRRMCGNCDLCFPRSFASHVRASNWSVRNELTARQVFKTSHLKFWFECFNCFHIFLACPSNVARGKFCGFCSSPVRFLCWDLACDWCYNNSFASHPKSLLWSPVNAISPRDISLNCNSAYLFDCACGHKISLRITHVVRGNWCQYCCTPGKSLCEDEDCDRCFRRSFASHAKALEWSPRNDVKPRDVFLNSNTKYILDCATCGHDYSTPLCAVVRGTGCNVCYKKTEKKLLLWLKDLLDTPVTYQPSFDWCVSSETQRKLPFDFSVPYLQMIIEIDGLQHFQNVNKNWLPAEDQQERDEFKMNCAMAHGWTVIRILQEDVLEDKGNWAEKLRDRLTKRSSDPEPFPRAFTIRTGNPMAKLRKYHRERQAAQCVIREID